jgi:hypothetical protein
MDTRTKLKEAKFFLDALMETRDELEKFNYNLSAFLNSWRSVLDVMLYDFVEKYSLGLTRDDKVTDRDFWVAANAQNLMDALRLIEWWRKKQGVLKHNPLWEKRIITTHRGYPEMIQDRFYVTGSGANSTTISGDVVTSSEVPHEEAIPITPATSPEPRFVDFPNQSVIDLCTLAFNEMEGIVQEVEREFHVRL